MPKMASHISRCFGRFSGFVALVVKAGLRCRCCHSSFVAVQASLRSLRFQLFVGAPPWALVPAFQDVARLLAPNLGTVVALGV